MTSCDQSIVHHNFDIIVYWWTPLNGAELVRLMMNQPTKITCLRVQAGAIQAVCIKVEINSECFFPQKPHFCFFDHHRTGT